MTPHPQLRVSQWALLILGLLLLVSWSRNDLASRRFQSSEAKKLAIALDEGDRAELASSDTALDQSVPGGTRPTALGEGVLGMIEIPRLRITAMVAEGTDAKTLGRAVGHVATTALPGSPGNCALAGHRDTFLRGLGGVRVSDVIRIVTPEETFTYEVQWAEVVEPERVDLLNSTTTPSLTLITCYPFAFVGRAPQRFVVRARKVEARSGFQQGPLTERK